MIMEVKFSRFPLLLLIILTFLYKNTLNYFTSVGSGKKTALNNIFIKKAIGRMIYLGIIRNAISRTCSWEKLTQKSNLRFYIKLR